MVGHFGFGWPMVPAVDPDERPARIDLTTNAQRGAGWQPFDFFRYKPQTTGQVAWYVPDKAGSHDLKFGWDWQIDSNQFGWNTNSGNLRYRDSSGLGPPPPGAPADMLGAANQIDFFNVPTLNDDRNRHTDLFVQDVWTLNDRVTVSLGVRFGNQKLYYLAAAQTPELGEFFDPIDSPAGDLDSWSNLAPRLGITFDATGEGKTVVKGYYGRYYGNIGSGIQSSNPAGQQQLRYTFLDPNRNGIYDGQQELGNLVTCIGVCGEGGAGLPIEFDLMYADEYSVSVEHELMADTSLRFSYVRKQTRNNWGASTVNTSAAQINTSRTIERMTQNVDTPCTGCPEGYEGTTLNLRTLPEGAPDNDIRYTNAPGDSDGNYDTLQFAFKRRFRGNFFVNANFDYQWRKEMRIPEFEYASPLAVDPIAVQYYPEYNRNVSLSQNSKNWNFSLAARYVLPYEVGIAGTWRHQAGFPWAPIHVVDLPTVGTVNVFLEDIENNRSENVNIVDVRLDKTFTFSDKYKITGFFDIYNLLNVNPETNFNMRTGGGFYDIIEWLQGRTFKVGARFQF
jgi:hypothetical protein